MSLALAVLRAPPIVLRWLHRPAWQGRKQSVRSRRTKYDSLGDDETSMWYKDKRQDNVTYVSRDDVIRRAVCRDGGSGSGIDLVSSFPTTHHRFQSQVLGFKVSLTTRIYNASTTWFRLPTSSPSTDGNGND